VSAAPRVTVIFTGGTIGTGGADEMDRLDYPDYGTVLSDEDALPLYRFPSEVDVTTRRFARIRSTDVSETFWWELLSTINEIIREDPDVSGIVITHGTATLEETAYFLHLTLNSTVPVVLVGAQRPPTAMGSDSQVGLLNAIAVAASPASVGHGVLVAMDDQIFTARDVTKSSNYRLSTFIARDHGALGDVDSYGAVWFYRKSLRAHTVASRFALDAPAYELPLPRVDIVAVYAGADGAAIDAAVANGARGLVISALPPSMNPSAVNEAIERATAAGVVVVHSSRASTGRVTQRRKLDELGLVGSDTLSPQGARILLSLGMASGLHLDELVDAFATY
jgi:L-asparaginase